MADDSNSELAVLVCSANVGNAEPTPESFAEWVPDDGEIDGPLSQTKYPVEADGAEGVRASLSGANKKFDIIVIGMQEAAFVEKRRRSSQFDVDGLEESKSNGADGAAGATENSHAQPLRATEFIGAVENRVAEAKKETKKGSHHVFKKFVKANMLLRGLTTSETYKAPTLRHHDKGDHHKVYDIKSASYDTMKLIELIENRCPSYAIVTAKLRGEMRLIVLVLKDLAEEISDVYTAGENTGIGSFLANKGGIIATFDLRGTRLSFMTCHLEAHEGNTHYLNRNKNLAEIFAGAKTDHNYPMHDAIIISHHMFVCGDLNYRIKLGEVETKQIRKTSRSKSAFKGKLKASGVMTKQFTNKMLTDSSTSDPNLGETASVDEKEVSPVSKKKPASIDKKKPVSVGERNVSFGSPSADEKKSPAANAANGTHYALAKSLMEAEDWKTLNDGDELAMALKKKECLAGFKTLPCNFPPTFKVDRCEGYQYNEKRTPSYTDRILWKSADGMVDNVVPFLYEPCPDFVTSDHKPIRGGYVVKTNREKHFKSPSPPVGTPKLGQSNQANNERQVQLLVSDIKCTNLPIMDNELIGGLADPYILFVSFPKPLLWKKAWPVTKIIKHNLNPEWVEDIHLTFDECADAKGNISLSGHMLYMTVMDEDIGNGDDLIGTVALNVKELCSNLELKVHDNLNSSTGNLHSSNTKSTSTGNIQTTKISRPVLRNGLEFGMLECTISAGYLAPGKETKDFLKSAKKVRSKTQKISLTNKIFGLVPWSN